MGFWCTFYIKNKYKLLWSILLGVSYAASDEFHQSFVPGRGPSIRDVCIDSAVIKIKDNMNSKVLNNVVASELVIEPVDKKVKKSKVILHKIERVSYFSIKRIFDIICSLLGIIALIPVAIVTKICYIATGDKKSIFYKQKRIGKNGKPIYIYKFRSMVWNADEVLKELLKDPKYKKEWDLNQKFENDPRITKMENILRKTSLDELPQIINVLKGDMSMIGPRPLVEDELDAHKGNHAIYESVRPGISGW